MKKHLILSALMTSVLALGQHFCGYDLVNGQQDETPALIQEQREMNEKYQRLGVDGVLREMGYLKSSESLFGPSPMNSVSGIYQGAIYEIPIVVHVIEANDAANAQYKLTDEQIKTWIENTNKIYATTYGNGFFEEGEGAKKGAVIPFRLVLAQRTPNCQPTTGIVRYDATNIPDYATKGVRLPNIGRTGATIEEVKRLALARHWNEKSYYNIYIVVGIEGRKGVSGSVLGWAGAAGEANPDKYEAVMQASAVTNPHDITLAHEFGHSLGLAHPFGRTEDGTCPPKTGANGNCNVDDDKVCDTEPTITLLNQSVPSENDINPCTNRPYNGVQYNIMHYTSQPRKFTAGQRDMALISFLGKRASLTQSLGAKPVENIDVRPATCVGSRIVSSASAHRMGITRVQLGNIDNATSGYQVNSGKFYTDYTKELCKVYTDIIEGEQPQITITKPTYEQLVVVWIDFNDDGRFEDNEKVLNNLKTKDANVVGTITIPNTAVKEKYLRMRVKSDFHTAQSGACADATYGEVEDYAVRILPQNWIDPNDSDGRVGINIETPKNTLDVRETSLLPTTTPQGVLFPAFTTAERDTFTAVEEGTMIFNKNNKCVEIYTNGAWNCLN